MMRHMLGWALLVLVALPLALLIAGLYFPEWISQLAIYQAFASTRFGEFWLGQVWPYILSNGRAVLQVGTNLAILLFALYIWWRNASVRRLCASVLYDNCFNVLFYWDRVTDKLEIKENDKQLSILMTASPDTRGWALRLSSQLEVLSNFAIAYDHALSQHGRMHAAFGRMYALDAKELVEQLCAELQRAEDDEKIELATLRYFSISPFESPRGWAPGRSTEKQKEKPSITHQLVFIDRLLYQVVDVNLELALKLDGINWFTKFFLSPGRNAPEGLRGAIAQMLRWHRERKVKRQAPRIPFATFGKAESSEDVKSMLKHMQEVQFRRMPKS